MFKSVLIVDDVDLSREVIKSAVQASNDLIKVTSVENAYAAINKMRTKSFDLIIMDIMMPNGDGFELLSMISQLSMSTKIIVISSLNSAVLNSMPEIGKLYDLNIIMALEKPIDSKKITQLVSEILEESNDFYQNEKLYTDDVNIFKFPIGAYYQAQVSADTESIIGVDISGNWYNSYDGQLLSTHLLPDVATLSGKKLFSQIVIGRFLQDYKEYFKDISAPLSFTFHIHNELVSDSFIYACLNEIVDLNPSHRFCFYIDKDDLIEMKDRTFINQIESLSSTNTSLVLGLDQVNTETELTISDTTFPIRELRFNIQGNLNVIDGNIDSIRSISHMAKKYKFSVMLDGVEDKVLSERAISIGLAKQQGILFGGPINAQKLMNLLIVQNKALPELEM